MPRVIKPIPIATSPMVFKAVFFWGGGGGISCADKLQQRQVRKIIKVGESLFMRVVSYTGSISSICFFISSRT